MESSGLSDMAQQCAKTVRLERALREQSARHDAEIDELEERLNRQCDQISRRMEHQISRQMEQSQQIGLLFGLLGVSGQNVTA